MTPEKRSSLCTTMLIISCIASFLFMVLAELDEIYSFPENLFMEVFVIVILAVGFIGWDLGIVFFRPKDHSGKKLLLPICLFFLSICFFFVVIIHGFLKYHD